MLPNTVVFAAVGRDRSRSSVGTLVALLLANLGTFWRTIVSSAIMVAWAMPAVTGTYVWVFIFDADRGIVNQTLMGPRAHGRALQLVHEPVSVLRASCS